MCCELLHTPERENLLTGRSISPKATSPWRMVKADISLNRPYAHRARYRDSKRDGGKPHWGTIVTIEIDCNWVIYLLSSRGKINPKSVTKNPGVGNVAYVGPNFPLHIKSKFVKGVLLKC